MIARLQWIGKHKEAGVVRVYEDGVPDDGPYLWHITFEEDPRFPTAAILYGQHKEANAPPSPDVMRAGEAALREQGFECWRYWNGVRRRWVHHNFRGRKCQHAAWPPPSPETGRREVSQSPGCP